MPRLSLKVLRKPEIQIWISGFILSVIPECLIFNITWYWMFLINIVGVYILGPIITKFFLVRMASGKGLGMDAFIALIIGIEDNNGDERYPT